MKILILGCTGMIGSEIFKQAHKYKNISVFGTYKTKKKIKFLFKKNLVFFDIENKKKLKSILKNIKPNILINATGITKHIKNKSKKEIFKINAKFPHYAKKIANNYNCKFIQISTDCVFNGNDGNYKENSKTNANDIYGISKIKGEIVDKKNLTVRTSTIGHEINSKNGLLEWFLSQKKICFGYNNAVFNGFPTYYFAKLLFFILLKKQNLVGLLHISGNKINKYELLKKFKKVYKKKIVIKKNKNYRIDRSLNNSRFKKYYKKIHNWNTLISNMKKNYEKPKSRFI